MATTPSPQSFWMGKHILFLADIFPPHFAPRVLSIVKYFVQIGAHCTVCTEEISNTAAGAHAQVFANEPDCCSVHRFKLRETFSTKESLKQALWGCKDKLMARKVEQQVPLNGVDLIVAFSYRTFPLGAAAHLARKYAIPLVCDCRDIVEQYNGYSFIPQVTQSPSWWLRIPLKILRRMFIKSRSRALKRAQIITTVSPWHQQKLQQLAANVPVHCLYNGYDSQLFVPNRTTSEKFTICYTGRIMSLGLRNPALLFDALELMPSHIVEDAAFEVAWYCDAQSQNILHSLLQKYSSKVKNAQHFYPMEPFQKVPHLLNQSSIVLLIANKEGGNGPKGIVSTKIFEALAVDKPILLLPSKENIAAHMLQGFSSVMVSEKARECALFIEGIFGDWRKNGYTCTTNSHRDAVQAYSRERIACAFAQICAELYINTKRVQ